MPKPAHTEEEYTAARQSMVNNQLIPRGIRDEHVLQAMATVPRHFFVPESVRTRAYEDNALPLDLHQTISQPYMVALMTELLSPQPAHTVLEVGTGSGYQTAILATLAKSVHTIERHEDLAKNAGKLLRDLGYENTHLHVGDGCLGLPDYAPFDRIIVTAGARAMPDSLVDQLAIGGILVSPIGGREEQELMILRRDTDGIKEAKGIPCRFVPLIGQGSWEP